MHVASEAVELGDRQSGALFAAELARRAQLRMLCERVGTLAGFGLSELADELPGSAVEVSRDCLTLRVEAQAARALIRFRHAVVRHEFPVCHHVTPR
ncbi:MULTISPECIES: hypothetical protein [Burkholderia]|uniref:hypothetical protein n=1 Tax=Burkholderia TaxID=32008 RepID=UPI001F064CCE|nr:MULTISPECIES: hypothetical protein [Burkholderia]